jgi:hypothetical protein
MSIFAILRVAAVVATCCRVLVDSLLAPNSAKKQRKLMLCVCTAASQAEVHDSKRAALLQMLDSYKAAKAQVQQQPTPPQLQGISRCADLRLSLQP